VAVPEGKTEFMLVLNHLLTSRLTLTACYFFHKNCNSCTSGKKGDIFLEIDGIFLLQSFLSW